MYKVIARISNLSILLVIFVALIGVNVTQFHKCGTDGHRHIRFAMLIDLSSCSNDSDDCLQTSLCNCNNCSCGCNQSNNADCKESNVNKLYKITDAVDIEGKVEILQPHYFIIPSVITLADESDYSFIVEISYFRSTTFSREEKTQEYLCTYLC